MTTNIVRKKKKL
jgi:hypothetical protein